MKRLTQADVKGIKKKAEKVRREGGARGGFALQRAVRKRKSNQLDSFAESDDSD